jgi:hypothetical protein
MRQTYGNHPRHDFSPSGKAQRLFLNSSIGISIEIHISFFFVGHGAPMARRYIPIARSIKNPCLA